MAKPTKRDILRLRKAALDGMVSYMKYGAAESETDPDFDEDFDAGYTQADINRCAKIIDDFLVLLVFRGAETRRPSPRDGTSASQSRSRP